MIRRWEMAFWAVLCGSTAMASSSCAVMYGAPNLDISFDPYVEPESEDLDAREADIPEDLLEEDMQEDGEEDAEELDVEDEG